MEHAPQNWAELQKRLAEVDVALRAADHLEPATQQELTALLTELSQATASPHVPAEAVDHLLASATHLLEVLREQNTQGASASTLERLEQAVLVTETRAPVLADISRRLIDVLTNLGI